MALRDIFRRKVAPATSDAPDTPPAFLRLDDEATSDFGTQVAMMMTMDPDSWAVHVSLRRFFHPQLGEFTYDQNDRLQHRGDYVPEGQLGMGNVQRALTKGDHAAITEAYRFMLLRPVKISERVIADQSSAMQQQVTAMKAMQQAMLNDQLASSRFVTGMLDGKVVK